MFVLWKIILEQLFVCFSIFIRRPGADPGFRRGGFVQEFRLENRSYPDVHDFSLRMQVIIANANNIADSRRGGFRAPKNPPCIRALRHLVGESVCLWLVCI